jgi:hypothetical protein
LLIAVLLLPGCAGNFITFKDPDSNANITRMNGNKLSGGITSVELNAQRFEKQGQVSYSLFVRYLGPALIEIPPGETLFIIIKEQHKGISGRGSKGNRHPLSIGLVEEVAYYHDLDPRIIRMIADAEEVQVEVKGSTGKVERYFNKKNFLRFKEFCDLYMGDATQSP